MENLGIYERVRQVPEAAKRSIQAGRLKGKTDINPMWRIKALTEQFGPCGIGWKYVITDKRLEQGANNEVAAFLDIDLFVKVDGAWSEARSVKEAHTMYERLLACGYPVELARDIVAQTDPAELERCVRMIELIYDDRREYV